MRNNSKCNFVRLLPHDVNCKHLDTSNTSNTPNTLNVLTNRLFRGSRHGGPSTEVAERAAIRGRRGMGAECACYAQRARPRKTVEGRGRPRKAAGRAEPEPRTAPVLCFHGNVEGTTPAEGGGTAPRRRKKISAISKTHLNRIFPASSRHHQPQPR